MQHASKQYDLDLAHINQLVQKMLNLVIAQFEKSVHAYWELDQKLAKEVSNLDAEVNRLEREVDDACAHVIVKRQPAAADLRLLMATLKCVTDLERVGDESAKIARIVSYQEAEHLPPPNATQVLDLKNIYALSDKQLKDAAQSFISGDKVLAEKVIKADDELDKMYFALVQKSIQSMQNEGGKILNTLNVMSAARSIERIGDHAKNIAEYTVFAVVGEDIRHPFDR